ncbi:uncharacterized protein J3R85_008790 [Psidium guajava]|nr:uncharacterized protein J3R85_008790 [Psidium guajava]
MNASRSPLFSRLTNELSCQSLVGACTESFKLERVAPFADLRGEVSSFGDNV